MFNGLICRSNSCNICWFYLLEPFLIHVQVIVSLSMSACCLCSFHTLCKQRIRNVRCICIFQVGTDDKLNFRCVQTNDTTGSYKSRKMMITLSSYEWYMYGTILWYGVKLMYWILGKFNVAGVLSPVCKAPIIVVFGLPLCCGYGVTGCKYVLCYIMQLSSLNHGYPSGGFFGLILLKIGVSVRWHWGQRSVSPGVLNVVTRTVIEGW